MNNVHPTIKFTFEGSTQKISFLYIKVHIAADCKLSATLYRKPTDCVALLPFHSNHSLNAKKALFSRRLLDTTSSLQMTTYYKKNSIPLQYLSLPENTFLKLSLVTSLKLSSALVTLFSTEPQGIKFQICPPSCDPLLIRRKTILQFSTRPLAYH